MSGASHPGDEAPSALAQAALDPSLDLYALLSLPDQPPIGPTSTQKEIKTAYRKKAKELHPDRNPDPNAAVLFDQLKRVFETLSDETVRAAYDARITAKAARAAKDASLDEALATMKRDLLRREAEAVTQRLEQAALARAAALNPRGAKTAAELSREANENLLRSMASVLQTQDQRPAKARRVDSSDASVHAGASSGEEQKDGTTGDEKSRTLVLRWPRKTSSSSDLLSCPPSSTDLHRWFDRFVGVGAGGVSLVEHLFLRSEKRKALVVFVSTAAARRACDAATRELPLEWEAKIMDASARTSDSRRAAHESFPAAAAAAATAATPASQPTPLFSSSSFPSADATTASGPSFEFGVGASANLTPEEYEAATMQRMAAIAKAKRLQREAAAAAAAAATTAATSTDGAAALSTQ